MEFLGHPLGVPLRLLVGSTVNAKIGLELFAGSGVWRHRTEIWEVSLKRAGIDRKAENEIY